MFKKISIFWCCLTLFAPSLPACATDIVDRIVATVNGHIILQSDWNADLEEVRKRVLEIRQQYPGKQSEQEWHTLLERYGVTQQGLESRIRAELDLTGLVDARLRPTVTVDAKSIESYYNQELLPQLHHSGATDVSLAEVTPKIKEVLTQEKMNQLLTAWLKDLRAGSEIHMDGFSPPEGRRNE